MRGSAPTARALDIVELLVRAGERRLRFSDVVRELELTQATAHAILTTLCDRGWATRDPVDKTFGVGPALAVVAARAQAARPLAVAARTAAAAVAAELGYPGSVVERVDDALVITAFAGGDAGHPAGQPGDRIPYAPPFGAAFAAWAPEPERRAWIDRCGADAAVTERLERVLARTRARGFDIDWTTPALAQAAHLVGELDEGGLPPRVRRIMEALLAEFGSVGLLSDDDPERETRPVVSLTAPVFGAHGEVALVLGAHPLRALTTAELVAAGAVLTRAAAGI
ncbi:helix-turn-helix domain-containing protein [Nocardia sp. NPDC050697]|uniref:helix-turn-helix domain-containing protein n=1 Tax=Nocardia sp. NPDC050697 TaxID=3155158 RepID=UPI0033D2E92A